MKLSLSAISTVNASFAEDVEAYAAAGFDAIGLWEFKLPEDDAANVELIRSHGLVVSHCIPAVPSFLPLALPGMEGPPAPQDRVDAIRTSIRRFAAYDPECVICLSGPLGKRSEPEGRSMVIDGLTQAAAAAREARVRLGFEPVHPGQRATAGFVATLDDALAVLEEAGVDDVGIMADTYNLANEATGDVVAAVSRVSGLHVADELEEPVPGVRALPDARGRSAELVAALRAAGWDGTLDVEIFSTPDAFWALPPDEAARQAHASASAL